jgi:predicted Zn-dependent peptidase
VVGAIDAERLSALLERTFGDLAEAPPLKPLPRVALANRGSRHVVDLDVPQSVIRFGTAGVSWTDPDFIPAYILNHILGGGVFTSRLFTEVREKRGLAYSVGTSLVSYRAAAMTWGYTATKNERVAEALGVIEGEMARLKADGPSEDELSKAKDYLLGSYALGFDTSTKIAHQLTQIAFEGFGHRLPVAPQRPDRRRHPRRRAPGGGAGDRRREAARRHRGATGGDLRRVSLPFRGGQGGVCTQAASFPIPSEWNIALALSPNPS